MSTGSGFTDSGGSLHGFSSGSAAALPPMAEDSEEAAPRQHDRAAEGGRLRARITSMLDVHAERLEGFAAARCVRVCATAARDSRAPARCHQHAAMR